MKNILFSIYTDGFPSQFTGGPNNIIYKIIKNFDSDDYKFDYLSRDLIYKELNPINLDELGSHIPSKRKVTNYLFENNLLFRKIFSNELYLPFHLVKKNKYFRSFKRKNNQYNIVHSQDSLSLPIITSENSVAKKIVTVHSNGPLSNEITSDIKNIRLKKIIKIKLQHLEKLAIKNADLITFPSYSAKELFLSDLHVNIDENKIKIIYNGIDTDYINLLTQPKNILKKYHIEQKYDFLFVNISTYREERQLDKLFGVIKILVKNLNKKILLLNVGSGSTNKELVRLVKKIGVEDYVRLIGKIPNEDVINILKMADVFIMLAKRVIFDISLLEAMAAGTCCVVSNEGGNKEIIKDGENGFLIDIENVDSIAKKIISILPYKDKVRENAIKTARQFSVQKMVNEYFEVYEGMLNGV